MKKENEEDEYMKQANNFLQKTGATISFKWLRYGVHFLVNEKAGLKHDIYEVTLVRGNRSFSFEFGVAPANSGRWILWRNGKECFNEKKVMQGYQTERNKDFKEPTAYDVLASLQKSDVGTFDDFCRDFGYSNDSIQAKKIYQLVLAEYNNLKMLFSDKELEEMAEIQ